MTRWNEESKLDGDKCVPASSPGEAEEDIDDGSCQVHTLLPVLPQNSGQGSKGRL